MTPVADMLAEKRTAVRALLFDIDDTITLRGRLPTCAYQAIERLHKAGFITIPITGGPAGWCDLIARIWPVDGVIGENGAFYFRNDPDEKRMRRRFWQDDATRRTNRERLEAIADEVLAEVPNARVAANQAYREVDLAIDISEDVDPLSTEEVASIQAVFARHGANAQRSSIHVNAWFGDFDKCAMALRMLEEIWGYTTEQAQHEVMYVGDAPNDAPMFERFPNSVGVANIIKFVTQLETKPRWVTQQPGGFGFAELADLLLESRQADRKD